jgi:hypothetical protein
MNTPFIPVSIPVSLDDIPIVKDQKRISKIKHDLSQNFHERLIERGDAISRNDISNDELAELQRVGFSLMRYGIEMLLCRVGDVSLAHNLLEQSNKYRRRARQTRKDDFLLS